MFEEVVGNNGGKFIIAAAAVALALLALIVVFWLMRNRASSPFLRGGKNRQPRLAVLDAAAVDTRRRLVLVRRDDVEHLIMIGGPTDIVIESRIIDARPGGEPAAATGPAQISSAATPLAPPPPSLARAPSTLPTPALPTSALPASALPASSLPVPADRSEAAGAPRPAVERRPDPRAPLPQEARPAARSEPDANRALPRAENPAAARAEPTPAPVAISSAQAPRGPQAVATQAPVPAQPPVSAMGQALYGEDAGASRPQPVRAAAAASVPAKAGAASRPVAVPTAQTPEDILDAARARVLPQIAAPAPNPPSASSPPAPFATPSASPETAKSADVRDFERLLDAQISGDLGRLTPAPSSPAPAAMSDRPSPRREPTLEEEMNRMLSEMGAERKS